MLLFQIQHYFRKSNWQKLFAKLTSRITEKCEYFLQLILSLGLCGVCVMGTNGLRKKKTLLLLGVDLLPKIPQPLCLAVNQTLE